MVRKYLDPGPVHFEAEIVRNTAVANSSAFIEFPHDLKETFGYGNLVPVAVVFDGTVSYRGSLTSPGGGRALLLMRKDVREELGKQPGDRVRVTLRLDDAPRPVEVPEDLADALDRAGLRHRFDALAPSHRREFVRWVDEAKRPETRQRRIDQARTMVGEGRTRN